MVSQRRRRIVASVAVLLAVVAVVAGVPALHLPALAGTAPVSASGTGGVATIGQPTGAAVPAYVPTAGVIPLGAAPPRAAMSVLVGLPSQNPDGVLAQAAAEYTVGSGAYHHYLTPAEVANEFGASAGTVRTTVAYFTGFGLTAQLLGGGSLLLVTGPTSSVAAAFDTTFDDYESPSGRVFVSHPTPATLPAGIPWAGAEGLGNVTLPVPLAVPLQDSAPLVGPDASCAGGSSGLSPCQIWNAYDATSLITNGTNGSGERIGIVDVYDGQEPQTQLESDLSSFDSIFSLPTPSVTYNYPVRSSVNLNSTSTGWGLEEALDLEWSHASAPGASIADTLAPNSNTGLYESVDWLVSTDRVDVISLSWGEPDVGIFNAFAGACTTECNASSDGSYEVLGPVLAAAALEGITVFVASGDCGAADGTSGVATNYPSSDPFATGVGGTVLTVSSSGAYQRETAWSGNSSGAASPGCENQGGSGGGFAPFPRPWWQTGTGLPSDPSTRGDPDVADDAATGVEIVQGGGVGGVGGTSLATPLWAGIGAIADQAAGGDLGFLNPELYSILRSSGYATDFHDIKSGSNGYNAGTGWDPVTGIGTPIVGALVPTLAQPVRSTSNLSVALSATPLRGASPLEVSFTLLPSRGSGTYPLEGVYFGDGTSALAATGTVSHRYSAAGIYPAVAYVADSSGNVSSSAPVAVVVDGSSLTVNLTVTDAQPAVGESDVFSASVSGGTPPYSYLFAYGDGTFLNGTSASAVAHSFPVAGSYCADVLVWDSATPANGGTSAEVGVAVGGAPAPDCPNQSVPFTVQATASPGVRDAPADFPDLFQVYGGSGNTTPTEVLSSSDPYVAACDCTIFRSPGSYSVSLSAVDSLGVHAFNETNVTVAPALVGTFTASTQSGPAPLTVDFSAAVSGGYRANAADTSWQFGVGPGTVGATASHTYGTPGFYLATADVEDSGLGNASEAFLIDVTGASSTVGSITATIAPAVNVSAGTLVNFSAQVPGEPDGPGFNWSLGGGESASSAATSATMYPGAGSRDRQLYLNVTLPGTADTDASSVELPIDLPSFFADEADGFVPRTNALALSASGAPSSGLVPFTWHGSAAATGPGATSFNWSFGNGASGSGPTAQEAFLTAGDYTANVTATDAWNDTARWPFAIAASETPTPIEVRAIVTPTAGTAPLTVTVQASATGGAGAPYAYDWNFGDGTTASEATGSHLYSAAGDYVVVLVAHDSSGAASAVTTWAVDVRANGTASSGSGWSSTDVTLALAVGAVAAVAAMALLVVVVRRRAR